MSGLLERLKKYSLTLKDLEQKCTKCHAIAIAKELSEWKIVGMCLDFTDGELKAIESNYNDEVERRVYFLDKWLKKYGDAATYRKLFEILISNDRNDLVDDMLKILNEEMRNQDEGIYPGDTSKEEERKKQDEGSYPGDTPKEEERKKKDGAYPGDTPKEEERTKQDGAYPGDTPKEEERTKQDEGIYPGDTSNEEDMRFICGCGQCSLDSFLKNGCANPWDHANFPLLNTQKMGAAKKLELISRLTEDARDISEKFASLTESVYCSLNDLDNFNVKSLRIFLLAQQKFLYMSKEKCNELQQSEDVETVMTFLLTENYINWFNYPLLGSIVKKFKVCMTEYQEYIDKDLTQFLQRSLFEIPADSFNISNDPQRSGQFILKLDVINAKVSLTADVLIHLRRHVSIILGIAIDAFEFCSYNKGCIQFVLAAPLSLLQNIFPLPDKALKSLSMFRYKGLHIKSVEFNNTQTVHDAKKEDNDEELRCDVSVFESTKLTDVFTAFAFLNVELYNSIEKSQIELHRAKKILCHLKCKTLTTPKERPLLCKVKDEIEKISSLADLFLFLNQFWSFYNYNLLEKLFKKIDSNKAEAKLKEYIVFLEALKVVEMPPLIQPYYNADSFHSDLLELRMQPNSLQTLLAEELLQTHKAIASALSIEHYALLLKQIKLADDKLVFLVPECVELGGDMMSSLSWSSLRENRIVGFSFKDNDYSDVEYDLSSTTESENEYRPKKQYVRGIKGKMVDAFVNAHPMRQSNVNPLSLPHSSAANLSTPINRSRLLYYHSGLPLSTGMPLSNVRYQEYQFTKSSYPSTQRPGSQKLSELSQGQQPLWDRLRHYFSGVTGLPLPNAANYPMSSKQDCQNLGESSQDNQESSFKQNKCLELEASNKLVHSSTNLRREDSDQTSITQPSPDDGIKIVQQKIDYNGRQEWKTHFITRLKNTELLDEDVEVELNASNYRKKLYYLLCFEESEHISLLTEKCDGEYELFLKGYEMIEGRHYYVGYIYGMSHDQMQYATQASEAMFIIDREKNEDVCRAEILPANFGNVNNKFLIALPFSSIKCFVQTFGITEGESCQVSVQFEVKHSYFDTLHKAVITIPQTMINKLFPTKEDLCKPLEMGVHRINHNCQIKALSIDEYGQLKALEVILQSPPNLPIIISGPFGSGKTRVLARAAYEFVKDGLHQQHSTRILICAHHYNTIETYVSNYLDPAFNGKQGVKVIKLMRKDNYGLSSNIIHRSVRSFREDIRCGCYVNDHILVIITTYTTSLHIADTLGSFQFYFTHILLDEVAQVREPEAIGALCLGTSDTKVVLAGDTKQVGPSIVVLVEVARDNGLKVSLLERLEKKYDEIGSSALCYCIKLYINYRCHPVVTSLLCDILYKYPLESSLSPSKQSLDCPCVFYCSTVTDDLTFDSSDFMDIEADAVVSQLKSCFQNWKQSTLKDICIMSSFRTQLNVIKKRLKKTIFHHVTLLPSYALQGYEFQAIVLSTYEPLEDNGESSNPTKTLVNPQVFNTAISRSRELVIAVGDPFRLLKSEKTMGHHTEGCWREYIKLCLEKNTMFFAQNLQPRFQKLKELLRVEVGISTKLSPSHSEKLYSSLGSDTVKHEKIYMSTGQTHSSVSESDGEGSIHKHKKDQAEAHTFLLGSEYNKEKQKGDQSKSGFSFEIHARSMSLPNDLPFKEPVYTFADVVKQPAPMKSVTK